MIQEYLHLKGMNLLDNERYWTNLIEMKFQTNEIRKFAWEKFRDVFLSHHFFNTNIKATLVYCLRKKLLVFCQNIRARHRDIVSNFAFKRVRATFVNVYCRKNIVFCVWHITQYWILRYTIKRIYFAQSLWY